MTTSFSHVGLCVTDAARSLAFYTGALGFEEGARYEVGEPFDIVMGVSKPLKLNSQFVSKDGIQLEFLHYASHEVTGAGEQRSMTQVGLTHLSVRVEAIEPAVEKVLAHGGQVHRETYVDAGPGGEFVYCSDPDGIRVELMRLPD